jgi:hypothetical protein
LKQAVRWRLVPLNVCMAVVQPRITKPEIQPLGRTSDEGSA